MKNIQIQGRKHLLGLSVIIKRGRQVVTNYEYVAKNFPSRIQSHAVGGVVGCPDDYNLNNTLRKNEYCTEDCKKCWQLLVKERN